MTEAEQVRREVLEFRQRLDGWGWAGTEVFAESPTCYRIESAPACHQPKQKTWVYWNGDGVAAQDKPPGPAERQR